MIVLAMAPEEFSIAHDIDIQLLWQHASLPNESEFERWSNAVLTAQQSDTPFGVSLSVVDASESQRLNREFRGKDRPTNVLSFPSSGDGLPPDMQHWLGDVIICGPLVVSEALEQSKTATDHWCHLCVHGCLHLLGFDHITDQDALDMERRERQILASFDVPDPYITR